MPAGGEAAGGQRCRARKLQVVSLLVSLVSLVLSLLLTLIVLTRPDNTNLTARLEDLEAEHDLLLEEMEGRVSPVCSLSPDPGPCTSSVRRYYYLPRYYLPISEDIILLVKSYM